MIELELGKLSVNDPLVFTLTEAGNGNNQYEQDHARVEKDLTRSFGEPVSAEQAATSPYFRGLVGPSGRIWDIGPSVFSTKEGLTHGDAIFKLAQNVRVPVHKLGVQSITNTDEAGGRHGNAEGELMLNYHGPLTSGHLRAARELFTHHHQMQYDLSAPDMIDQRSGQGRLQFEQHLKELGHTKTTEAAGGVDAYAPGHEFHGNQYVTVESTAGWSPAAGTIHTHTFPGGFFKDPLGKEWYVKAGKDLDHLKTEAFANKLYHMAGVKVPEVKFVDHEGQVKLAVAKVPGTVASHDQLAKSDDVRRGFAADAWLGNWDAVGTGRSNMLHQADGQVTRIDHAASLHRRAQGQTKPFEPVLPPELKSLREHSAKPVYAQVTAHDVRVGAMKIAAISTTKIKAAALQSGFNEKTAEHLSGVLATRAAALVAHATETADLLDHAKGGKSSTHDGQSQHIHSSDAPHHSLDFPSSAPLTSHVHDAQGALVKTGHDHLGPGGWSSAINGLSGGPDSHQHLPSGEVVQSTATGQKSTAHAHALADFNAGSFDHVADASLKEHGVGAVAAKHGSYNVEHTHSPDFPHLVNSGPSTSPHAHNSSGKPLTVSEHDPKLMAKMSPYDKMQHAKQYPNAGHVVNPTTPPVHADHVDYEMGTGIAAGATDPIYEQGKLSAAWLAKAGDVHGLGHYTGGGYGAYNPYFRNGGSYDKAPAGAKSIINAIKQGDGLPYAAVLYRGVRGGGNTYNAVSKLKAGDVFTELAFGSTSLTAYTPIHGIGHAGSHGLLFRLKVPKGYPAGYGSHGELEVILMPHTKIHIDEIHRDGDGYKSQGVNLVVEGTVVPHTMAEYLDPANKANQGMMDVRLWKTYPKCPLCKVTHKDMVKHLFAAHNLEAEHKVATGKPKAHDKYTQAKLSELLVKHFKSQGVEPHEHDGFVAHVHDPATGKLWAVGHGEAPKNTWQLPAAASVATQSPYAKGQFLHHKAPIEHEHDGLPVHKHGTSYADAAGVMMSSAAHGGAVVQKIHHHLPNGKMQEGFKK